MAKTLGEDTCTCIISGLHRVNPCQICMYMYMYSTDQLRGKERLCFRHAQNVCGKKRMRFTHAQSVCAQSQMHFTCEANERQTRPKREANAFVGNVSYRFSRHAGAICTLA